MRCIVINNILEIQTQLVLKYKYKKLEEKLSIEVRDKYKADLPRYLNIEGNDNLKIFSLSGSLIASGYTRIVIGDYGAFIEFSPIQAINKNYKIKEGQEYRVNDSRYNENVKYNWLTAQDDSDIKIYHQKKSVTYADYKFGMYYVSPYEIKI